MVQDMLMLPPQESSWLVQGMTMSPPQFILKGLCYLSELSLMVQDIFVLPPQNILNGSRHKCVTSQYFSDGFIYTQILKYLTGSRLVCATFPKF